MDERSLKLERWLAASPERLFAAWTDPVRLVRWFGPEGSRVADCTLDPRPGGRWRCVLVAPDASRWTVGGIYREVTPPRRLSFTWTWYDAEDRPGHETEVMLTLDAEGEGTRLVRHHTGFASAEARERHVAGWTGSLARLERAISAVVGGAVEVG